MGSENKEWTFLSHPNYIHNFLTRFFFQLKEVRKRAFSNFFKFSRIPKSLKICQGAKLNFLFLRRKNIFGYEKGSFLICRLKMKQNTQNCTFLRCGWTSWPTWGHLMRWRFKQLVEPDQWIIAPQPPSWWYTYGTNSLKNRTREKWFQTGDC